MKPHAATLAALFALSACRGATEEPRLVATTTALPRTTFAPAMAAPLEPERNTLWCASLSLAWGELRGLVGGEVHTVIPNRTVELLNASPVTRDDVRHATLVARAGWIHEGVVGEIQADLRAAFGTSDPWLDELAASGDVAAVAYARLERALAFEKAFEDFADWAIEFRYTVDGEPRTTRVDAFGIGGYDPTEPRDRALGNQVEILHHAADDDFVVRLVAKDADDRLLLARVPPAATLAATWSAVRARLDAAGPEPARSHIEPDELLAIPELDFHLTHRFDELAGLELANEAVAGLPLLEVRQDLRLRLDEEGLVVKSRAAFSLGAAIVVEPRKLVFDGPFLLALIEADATSPWLLAWIADPELLLPVE